LLCIINKPPSMQCSYMKEYTCFTLYDQSAIAAKGPTRFNEFRFFFLSEENDTDTKYISPPLYFVPSIFCCQRPLGARWPLYCFVHNETLRSPFPYPIYALSIPIRATVVGRSSNLAIEWYLT